MKDNETVERFIHLRCQGWTLSKICQELHVCKQTLINWSRKHQYAIQNQRAIQLEALQNKLLATQETRALALGEQLQKIEAELAKRDITELSTPKLFALAQTLRNQIMKETGGPVQLTTPVKEIPPDEFCEEAQTWKA